MNTADEIVSAAESVHSVLGEGHSEATYHRAMERELSERGIGFSSEGTISIFYKGSPVGKRRPDMFVDDVDGTIVVELKSGSRKGEDQLFDYQSILNDDNNYNITGGVLIRFNDDVGVIRS